MVRTAASDVCGGLNVWREEGSQNQTDTRGKVGERQTARPRSLAVSLYEKKEEMQQKVGICNVFKMYVPFPCSEYEIAQTK